MSEAAPCAGGLAASAPAACWGQFAGEVGWSSSGVGGLSHRLPRSLVPCPGAGCPGRWRTARVSEERGLPEAGRDAVSLVLFRFVSVSALLCPSLTRSSWSSAPALLPLARFFFSFSFYHLYSLFSFLHLQGCLQQSSGRQCYLAAQPVPLLSLQYLICSNAWLEQGPRRGVRPPHTHPCPLTLAALPSGRDTGRATSRQGGQERGSCGSSTVKRHPERFTLCLLEGNAIN